ncbi:MAG: PBP1A family penicillin-binding protein [Acidobacteriia bacterium]|nr:PBP1A family penicillin-binding protein [Terriglobia bacterium]
MPATPPPSNRSPSGSRRSSGKPRWKGLAWWKKGLIGLFLLAFLAATGVYVYYYVRFSRLIDARLSGDIFANASQVFAAPTEVRVGQELAPEELAARLRRGLYAEAAGGSEVGTYKLAGAHLEIRPGPASFFATEKEPEGPAALEFKDGRLSSITALDRSRPLDSYQLEPEVLTTLFDRNRGKRRLVHYQDLPKVLINAIVATEDHRFFSHSGVNIYRILVASLAGIHGEDRIRGTSTLTMQLARDFFLTRERTLRRKAREIFLALLMEQRLSKEQIFELYANQIYLGQRGSFSVYGVGEAASAYFDKDVSSLTLPEAALIAGLIHGPNRDSPYKYAGRALERRNFVLRRMLEVGFITPAEAEQASAAPLGLAQKNVEGSQAPYFVDMVRDQLLDKYSEHDLLSQSYRIYTTLDLDLQRAASDGIRAGMVEVDGELKKRRRAKAPPPEPNQPQVALVALDPATGALRALVGGRDYGVSQLNHVLAKRQPGSSFKPFVYATALSSAVDGSQPLVTPATILLDEPTTFQFADQPYEPENYKKEYYGPVTVRQALTLSLNVATVRLAEMVGYDKVRALAIAAGVNKDLLATPALALGAYVATPLEIAGAYTVFANHGQYEAPSFILAVKDASGRVLWRSPEETRPVLDPRISYLMVSLMQSVINNGTGAGVRSRGFTLPAAGKTGTSHDGWFAGFTSDLLAVVWVGYDDDRELKLSGASSALPVWTEFMKHAAEIPEYRDPPPFSAPEGVVTATLDARTNLVADASATETRDEVFVAGTEPSPTGSRETGTFGILSRIFRPGKAVTVPVVASAPTLPLPPGAPPASLGGQTSPAEQVPQPPPPPQKKPGGVIRKFLSIFKGKDSSSPKPTEPAPPPRKPEQKGK